jgi:hypothetical protein
MYNKPQVVKFGTLRELTQLGLGADCDGGISIGPITVVPDGSDIGCRRS